jgi:hypothetical protein
MKQYIFLDYLSGFLENLSFYFLWYIISSDILSTCGLMNFLVKRITKKSKYYLPLLKISVTPLGLQICKRFMCPTQKAFLAQRVHPEESFLDCKPLTVSASGAHAMNFLHFILFLPCHM